MNKVLSVYKPVGMTPLELIHAVRQEFPEYANYKIGYAGRLDPLAHGVMLLMIGDATKEREKYLNLDKVYEFEALFGVETDTYDVLGLLKHSNLSKTSIVKEKVNLFVNEHTGTSIQSYPPYSSKAVQGKPLFWWARNNKLSEIQIPQREVVIKSFETLSFDEMKREGLQERIIETIQKVTGDFRQDEIRKCWESFFAQTTANTFQTATFRVHCSSGTYVRGLIHELGKTLGTGAIALDIQRTHIGNYSYPLNKSVLI